MKKFFKYALPAVPLLGVIAACDKEYESIEVIDERNVQAYIRQNNLNVTEYQDSGIYFQVVNPGSGTDLEYSDQVPVILTLKSLDGRYVSTDTMAISNRYYNFLGYFNPEGLRIGIKEVLKKRSGTVRMIIPSRLAFGRNGVGDIPGNASLDVTARVLDPGKMVSYEDAVITRYLAANNLTGFTRTSKGSYYKIENPGTGSPIAQDSTIKAEYTGKFLNGKVFDQTAAGSPASFKLTLFGPMTNGVIQGWVDVIPLIKEGGSIRMILPSTQGYGLAGDASSGMAPFTQLDFTVKVTDVSP